MPNFTDLELAVLDAIADETTDQAPELPGQIADARVTDRIQTSAGFITRIQVDPARTAPIEAAPARLGTIHADIAGLADPVGFRAVIEHGFLTALETETYGQDASAIDFTTAPFSGLFRITPEGESVAVTPPSPALPPQSPLHRIQQEAYPVLSPDTRPFRPKDVFTLRGDHHASSGELLRLQSARLPFPLNILFMALDFVVFGLIVVFFLGLHERIPGLSGLSVDTAVAIFVPIAIGITLLRWLLLRRAKAQADGQV